MYSVENHATAGAHVHLSPGTVIAQQYEVVKEAGSGNFARVFHCRDIRSGAEVAVKLMKPGYERDADFECDVLQTVVKNDPSDMSGIVRLLHRFTWQGHAALVFNLKGTALRTARLPMRAEEVAQVAKDVANALDFLHFTCRAVHTDLKPDNILAEREECGRRWSVCDFGSSSFYTSALDNDLITTRPYRAPEVVLKRGWNYNADTWSLGCILYELHTGRKLFDARTDAEHIELMQARLGAMPASMCPSRPLSLNRYAAKPALLREELRDAPVFLDLLLKLLAFEPSTRPRCRDILSHPYLTQGSQAAAPTATTFTAKTASYQTLLDNAAANRYATAASHEARRLSAVNPSAFNVPQPYSGSTAKPQFSGPTAGATYKALHHLESMNRLPHPSYSRPTSAAKQLISPTIPSSMYTR